MMRITKFLSFCTIWLGFQRERGLRRMHPRPLPLVVDSVKQLVSSRLRLFTARQAS